MANRELHVLFETGKDGLERITTKFVGEWNGNHVYAVMRAVSKGYKQYLVDRRRGSNNEEEKATWKKLEDLTSNSLLKEKLTQTVQVQKSSKQ